jgi:hypothetical protein
VLRNNFLLLWHRVQHGCQYPRSLPSLLVRYNTPTRRVRLIFYRITQSRHVSMLVRRCPTWLPFCVMVTIWCWYFDALDVLIEFQHVVLVDVCLFRKTIRQSIQCSLTRFLANVETGEIQRRSMPSILQHCKSTISTCGDESFELSTSRTMNTMWMTRSVGTKNVRCATCERDFGEKLRRSGLATKVVLNLSSHLQIRIGHRAESVVDLPNLTRHWSQSVVARSTHLELAQYRSASNLVFELRSFNGRHYW